MRKKYVQGHSGGGTIKAQPKIDGHQCSYESSQPAEQSQDQRDGDQDFGEVAHSTGAVSVICLSGGSFHKDCSHHIAPIKNRASQFRTYRTER